MKFKIKKQQGITLIVLIITIVVLLILAGVSIAMLTGDNGLLEQAKKAKEKNTYGEACEVMSLKIQSILIERNIESSDKINLQYLAEKLDPDVDSEVEYIELSSKIASIDITQIGDTTNSLFVKLKKYEYEFEINKNFEIENANSTEDTVRLCTMTYDNNGGTGDSSKTGKYGSQWGTLSQPTKTNYEFEGWYEGSKQIKSTTIVTGDITVVAKWIISKCTITFDPNGGTLAEEDLTKKIPADSTSYGELPTPTRDGYSFKGWYTLASGGTLIVDSANIGSITNITLYAQWEKIDEIDWDGTNAVVHYGQKVEKVTLQPGTYKFEVYGGQGGKSVHGTRGGYGGYSYGTYKVTKTTSIYLAVGGAGISASGSSTGGLLYGAWNGGGNGAETNNDSAGGGSASHIALVPGLLYELEEQKDKVLIVAGGGGGAGCTNTCGGDGGGTSGGTGTGTSYHAGSGGTQTEGGVAGEFDGSLSQSGSFGLGGSTGTSLSWPGAGGGGRLVWRRSRS